MNNSKAHEKLVDEIMLAVGTHPILGPKIRLWVRVVGRGRALKTERVISFGIRGESDVQGIIMGSGRYVCIEVKTGRAVLSVDQLKYRAMMVKFGAVHIEARSVEQVVTELLKYI